MTHSLTREFLKKLYLMILIDGDKIRSNNGGDDNDFIINKLNEYGAVVGKIVTNPNTVDTNDIKLFIRSVLEYSKSTNKYVGLALLAGNEITSDAMDYAKNYSNNSIGYLIIIEKPGIMNSV